jgi:hypothetical protein
MLTDCAPTSRRRHKSRGGPGESPGILYSASGDVAQLAEHLLCKQDVVGSIPIVSTIKAPGKELFLALIESAVVPLSCQYEWHDSGPCGVSPGDVCCKSAARSGAVPPILWPPLAEIAGGCRHDARLTGSGANRGRSEYSPRRTLTPLRNRQHDRSWPSFDVRTGDARYGTPAVRKKCRS